MQQRTEKKVTKVEGIVKAGGNSGRIYLPKAWIGKKVRVVLIAGLMSLTLVMAAAGTPMLQHVSAKHGGSSSSTGSSHGGLTQIASNKTDYPDNDPSVIQVHVSSAKKDILGDYELKGELTNVGNDSLQFVHINAHVYDATGQLVGNGDGYTTPNNLDAQHTGIFDLFITKDSLSGKPTSYRLSYDWS